MEHGILVDIGLNVIFDILCCAEIILFLRIVLRIELTKSVIRWIICDLLLLGINLLKLYPMVGFETDLVSPLIHIAVTMICVKEEFKDNLVHVLFAYWGLNGVNTCAVIILVYISKLLDIVNGHINLLVNCFDSRIIKSIIIISLIMLFSVFIKKIPLYAYWISLVKRRVYWILTFSMFIMGAINSLIEFVINSVESETAFVLEMAIVVLDISVYFVCIQLAKMNYINVCLDKEKHIMNRYLEMAREHYENLETQIKEIRRIKHDMNSHYYALDSFIEKRDWKGAREFIDLMRENQLSAYYNVTYTGNDLVDAVLMGIQNKYPDIKVECQGVLIGSRINDYDLCTIFSNLVKNAMEATDNIKTMSKIVRIEIRHFDDNQIISVSNPVEGDVDIDNFGKYTTKCDKEYHGYGIVNVRLAVEKYSGDFRYYFENSIVSAVVTI